MLTPKLRRFSPSVALLAVMLVCTSGEGQQQPGAVPREELGWHVLHALALGADMATTRKVLDTCPGCREINPFAGSRPSTARLVGVAVPLSVGVAFIVHQCYATGHRRAARLLSLEYTALHATAAGLNSQHIR